jgi:hypothetical protein
MIGDKPPIKWGGQAQVISVRSKKKGPILRSALEGISVSR